MRIRNPKTNSEQHTAVSSQSNKPHAWLHPNPVGEPLASPVPHVLIVDDDDGICHLLEQLLVESGYAVSTCREASGALEELEKEHIDLVLTDVRLPGMSGVELTKRIVERWP